MTGIAMQALKNSDTIIGYTVYVDLVKDTFPDKEFLTTPMKKEVDRCVLAFEEAMKGKSVSMICSGDAGVYGMAGLMYEVGTKYPEVALHGCKSIHVWHFYIHQYGIGRKILE